MAYYQNQGIDEKEAMKLVAKDRGISKSIIYQVFYIINHCKAKVNMIE